MVKLSKSIGKNVGRKLRRTYSDAASANLTGPYTDPSPPVSPNFREAPMLIPSPDGQAWYLYGKALPSPSNYLPPVDISLEDGRAFFQVDV